MGLANPVASFVPAYDQERVLSALLPYMRGPVEEASKVYKFRITSPRRRVGWKVTTPIKAYRRRLKEKKDD